MIFLREDKVGMDTCLTAMQQAEEAQPLYAHGAGDDAFVEAFIALGYVQIPPDHPAACCDCPEPGACGHRPWCGVAKGEDASFLSEALMDNPPYGDLATSERARSLLARWKALGCPRDASGAMILPPERHINP